MASLLDIEKRRVVPADAAPSAFLTCDVLVAGGGLGGCAAAEALIRRGLTVVVTEPTGVVGGQLTSQLVAPPDETQYVEREPFGQSTGAYRRLRAEARAHYAAHPEIAPDAHRNVGACWVSRVSATPDVRERLLVARLAGAAAVLTRTQIAAVGIKGGRFAWADAAGLDTGRVTRISARFLLDATEDGDVLDKAGLPTTLGQEARSTYSEPDAPDDAHPEWVQSFTYCFAVRWAAPGEPMPIASRPAEYDAFKALGEYTLDYEYSNPRRTVTYRVLDSAPGGGGPFWTYRRLLAASSFAGGASPIGDVALINWRGNDFNDETYLGKPPEEQARVLERGREFARGFLYWLQTECPRDDGSGSGYPEMQPAPLPSGTGADGFALHPYVRESRRLRGAVFPLTEQHLTTGLSEGAPWGPELFDSIGCAAYAIDIHPAKGEPHRLSPALPYHIPLGALLTTAGPTNVLPAAKNFGASRLALASARMHPTEWLVGEAAGTLAAFCIREGVADPRAVRETPALLAAFQAELREAGTPLSWREVINA